MPSQNLSNRIGAYEIAVTGRLVKTIQLRKEFYENVDDPIDFAESLRSTRQKADLFTFLQRFPESEPKYNYEMEWENFAAIKITSYENWYRRELPKPTRRGLRKAESSGVKTRWFELDEEMVSGITTIFNEAPLRQGKRFSHYGRDVESVKSIMSRDPEKSKFLGAFYGRELIGFTKLLLGPNYVRTTVLLAKIAHRDKYPNNAMIAHAVRFCVEQGIPYLVYGQLEYGNVGSKSLAEFKVNNGFRKVEIPRYYVPLTWKGTISLKLGFHRGAVSLIPPRVIESAKRLRERWYKLTVASKRGSAETKAAGAASPVAGAAK